MPGSRGFLAAVLKPTLRAVCVPASATSAVSGFVYAGDRVDVLLTHTLNGPNGQHSATETILRNARVIAMDQKLDFAPGDKPDVAKTATLELRATGCICAARQPARQARHRWHRLGGFNGASGRA